MHAVRWSNFVCVSVCIVLHSVCIVLSWAARESTVFVVLAPEETLMRPVPTVPVGGVVLILLV